MAQQVFHVYDHVQWSKCSPLYQLIILEFLLGLAHRSIQGFTTQSLVRISATAEQLSQACREINARAVDNMDDEQRADLQAY